MGCHRSSIDRFALVATVVVVTFVAGCSDPIPAEPTNYDPRVRVVDVGHHGDVEGVAFSPDGRMLATTSNDDTLRIWDLAAGVSLRGLPRDTRQSWVVVFSPDSRIVATAGQLTRRGAADSAGWDAGVVLWDVASGQLLASVSGFEESVTDIAFSPDGTTLAVASHSWHDGASTWVVKLWDMAAKRFTLTRTGKGGSGKVAFSQDGQLLAVSAAGAVNLYRMPDWGLIDTFPGGTVALSPDGTLIAFGATGGVQIRDMTGHTRATIPAEVLVDLVFSPNGAMLAVGTIDGVVRLCDTQSGQVVATDPGRFQTYYLWGNGDVGIGVLQDVAFSPDGRTVAAADGYRRVRLWDLSGPPSGSDARRSPRPSANAVS